MTTIQLRIDEKTKTQVGKVFKGMGLDMSSGIKMYLARVAKDKAIPFEVRTVNGFTPEYERRMLEETAWAEKHGKRYSSMEEIVRDFWGDEYYEKEYKK